MEFDRIELDWISGAEQGDDEEDDLAPTQAWLENEADLTFNKIVLAALQKKYNEIKTSGDRQEIARINRQIAQRNTKKRQLAIKSESLKLKIRQEYDDPYEALMDDLAYWREDTGAYNAIHVTYSNPLVGEITRYDLYGFILSDLLDQQDVWSPI